ncbi:hypothetical protein [Burkholderia cenocepacia]|uniref:DUF2568 domain-containing protein n=1 Tax=Burkholderia cenocepacia TaxID=95486 RepID=A0A6B2MNJ6_9BURK|nr:hypothetical protein [Burkholderia cenocepacia]NDV77060.1 hypothetical protein [Burkholderia cenocepacia]
MKDLILGLVVEGLMIGSFLAWKALGLDTAGTFFVVMMWIWTVMMAPAVLGASPRPKRQGFLSWVRWLKGCVVAAVIVCACIYAGLVSLAVCYTLAWMLLQAKYSAPEAA